MVEGATCRKTPRQLNVSSLIWMIMMSYVFFWVLSEAQGRWTMFAPIFFFEIHRIFLQVFTGTTIWHQNVPFPMAKAGDGDRKATGRAALWQRWTFLAAWNVLSYPHCDCTNRWLKKSTKKLKVRCINQAIRDLSGGCNSPDDGPITILSYLPDFQQIFSFQERVAQVPKTTEVLGWLALFIVKDVNKHDRLMFAKFCQIKSKSMSTYSIILVSHESRWLIRF